MRCYSSLSKRLSIGSQDLWFHWSESYLLLQSIFSQFSNRVRMWERLIRLWKWTLTFKTQKHLRSYNRLERLVQHACIFVHQSWVGNNNRFVCQVGFKLFFIYEPLKLKLYLELLWTFSTNFRIPFDGLYRDYASFSQRKSVFSLNL